MPTDSEEANFFIEKFLGHEEIKNDTCYLLAEEKRNDD